MPPLSSVQFAFPWAFLGLLVWLVLPRKQGWGWRFLATALLVTALAQPSLPQSGGQTTILVEASEHAGENALWAAEAFDFADLNPAPTVFYYAGDTTRVEDGLATPLSEVDFLGPQHSDLSRALQVAGASGARRILLISSGSESLGDARSAVPDVPVDVHRVARQASVRLTRLLAPEQVTPGERVEVTAVIEADEAGEVTLRPELNGEPLPEVRRQVSAGRNPVQFRFTAEGTRDMSFALELSDSTLSVPTVGRSQRTEIGLADTPSILVVGDPAMATLLRAQDFNIVTGTTADISDPLGHDVVILREHAGSLTPGQMRLLEEHVRAGGGLMMTGGEESFGLGQWARTPVEEVLPVHTDLRIDIETPLVATVIVFDRSSSMRAERPSRISLARQGAISLLELTASEDLLGLITFDSDHEWSFRPRQATDQGKREMYQAIQEISPRGGTIIGPAYAEAIDALREVEAAIKHIIILSDGEFFDGTGLQGPASQAPRPDFEAMAREAREDGVTTTTIGFGEADFDTIRRMARAGGGRFYGVTDTSELPRILTGEALTISRSFLRDGGITPYQHSHPLTRTLTDVPPPVEAYVATRLKRGAEMLLEGQDREPILATARKGLGRSAALTTDLNAWAGDLAHWEELPGLVGSVVRWLQTSPPTYSATATREGSRLRVIVDAVQEGEYIEDENLLARYGGQEILLEQSAPGRYEGTFDVPTEGGNVVVARGTEVVARAPVTSTLAHHDPAEAEALLREIARMSGGEIIPEPTRYAPVTERESAPLWPLLAGAGLLLFGLELIYRRLVKLV